MTEILEILGFFESPSDNEFLLVFLYLVPVVVLDWDMSPTFFLLFGYEFQRLSYCFLWDVLISRLTYGTLT
jgi:hypothetical protein